MAEVQVGRLSDASLEWTILLMSATALSAAAVLLWLAYRTLRRKRDAAGLLDWVSAIGALLAVIGITWVSVPMLMLPACA